MRPAKFALSEASSCAAEQLAATGELKSGAPHLVVIFLRVVKNSIAPLRVSEITK